MKNLSIVQICCVVFFIPASPGASNCHVLPYFLDFRPAALQVDQSDKRERLNTFPKFDEYGDLSFDKEKKRLDYFAQELTSVSEEPGYIIEYRSRREKRKPLARAKRAKDYLVRIKGIDARRIHIVNGGYHKEFKIELRLGPILHE